MVYVVADPSMLSVIVKFSYVNKQTKINRAFHTNNDSIEGSYRFIEGCVNKY